MKILTAEEFTAKVMENGTELEVVDACTLDVYAHINANGELVHSVSGAEWTISSRIALDDADQASAMLDGCLDDAEKEIIVSDLYPQYVATLKENEEWIDL